MKTKRDDTIYRQTAIDAINSHFGFNIEEEYGSAVQEVINGLPSAQPEQHWILCSERLPEDSQLVLMTIRRMDEHYNHEPFISVGYISWNQSAWWCAHDGDCKSNDVRVDAWMPLPEPWEEEE